MLTADRSGLLREAALPRMVWMQLSGRRKLLTDEKGRGGIPGHGPTELGPLEREPEAKLANEGVRDVGVARGNEAIRCPEARRTRGAVEVVAIVGLVGEIEGLEQGLQVCLLAELPVFAEAHVNLVERPATQGVVGHDCTLPRRQASASCSALA